MNSSCYDAMRLFTFPVIPVERDVAWWVMGTRSPSPYFIHLLPCKAISSDLEPKFLPLCSDG